MDFSALAALFTATPEERAAAASANPALAPIVAGIEAQLAAQRAAIIAEVKASRKPRAEREPSWWDVGVGSSLERVASLFDCADLDSFVSLVERKLDESPTSGGSVTASAGPLRVVIFHDGRITESAFSSRIAEVLKGDTGAAADKARKLIKAARGIPADQRNDWRAAREKDLAQALAQSATTPATSADAPVLPD